MLFQFQMIKDEINSCCFVFKGRIQYANPILSWLTQDQHYGQGFYSIQVHTHTQFFLLVL